MGRQLQLFNEVSNFKTLDIDVGGTGASTATQAAANLKGLTVATLGQPGGVAILDHQTVPKLAGAAMPAVLAIPAINIKGPTGLVKSLQAQYEITDMDSAVTYTVTTTVGTVSYLDGIITYTAPGSAQSGGFTVNGVEFPVAILDTQVKTPAITSPAPLAANQDYLTTFTATVGEVLGFSGGLTLTADWELATDPTFRTIVFSTYDDATAITSWTVVGLHSDTTYYTRVRHHEAAHGVSAWSPTLQCSTKAFYLPTTQDAILSASDLAVGDHFGMAMAFSGDGNRLAIGAPDKTITGFTTAGQVYVYTKHGLDWMLEYTVISPDKAQGDQFGSSVSLNHDGSELLVGALGKDGTALTDAGRVYVFERTLANWYYSYSITSPEDQTLAWFGSSIAVSGNDQLLAIGSPGKVVSGLTNAGKVYFYKRVNNQWQYLNVLSEGIEDDLFGTGLSLSYNGSRLLVGVPGSKIPAPQGGGTPVYNVGQVYVYLRSGTSWILETSFYPPAADQTFNLYFGTDVAINDAGDELIVSAYGRTVSALAGAGKVYLYKRVEFNWSFITSFTASDLAGNDYFGRGLTMERDGGRFAIGAPSRNSSSVSDAGAVYFFR